MASLIAEMCSECFGQSARLMELLIAAMCSDLACTKSVTGYGLMASLIAVMWGGSCSGYVQYEVCREV